MAAYWSAMTAATKFGRFRIRNSLQRVRHLGKECPLNWTRRLGMKPTFLLILTFGILSAAEVKLPPPFQTPSSTNRPRVIAKPEGAQLRVPQGFRVEEFAADLSKARIMLYTPSGEILV